MQTSTMEPIRYWDRKQGCEQSERVYGGAALKSLYSTSIGQTLADQVLSARWVSQLYGAVQSASWSRKKIDTFIDRFGIRMDEFEAGPFASFNEFFIRKFRPGMRTFAETPSALPAFAEGRYLAYEQVQFDQGVPIKGRQLKLSGLLGDSQIAAEYENGPLLVSRLCPVDYHRFHFPDAGKVQKEYRLVGKFHSVNPWALQVKSEIFVTNERHVTLLDTQNFGTLAYIEVGALCVGKIVQTYLDASQSPAPSAHGSAFSRGQEKGYFLFGASTVVLVGKPGSFVPDPDLLANTRRGLETFVELGAQVGSR